MASPYCGDDVCRPLGVLERGGAEVDALGAGLEGALEADASSRMPPESSTLHAAHLPDHLPQDAGVVAAAERGVEVDEVDPLGALVGPVGGGVDGVAVVRLGAGLALGQPHGLAVGDVDGGQQHRDGGSC